MRFFAIWPELARRHPERIIPGRMGRSHGRLTRIAVAVDDEFHGWWANASADEHGLRITLVLARVAEPAVRIPWEHLSLTELEETRAIVRVAEANVSVRLRAPLVIAQLRYWLDAPDEAEDEAARLEREARREEDPPEPD